MSPLIKFEQCVFKALDDKSHMIHFNRIHRHDLTAERMGYMLAAVDDNRITGEGFDAIAVKDFVSYVFEYVYMPQYMKKVWEKNGVR